MTQRTPAMNVFPLPLKAKVCILSTRRYGDAIITASIAKKAAISRPDLEWFVWTKPEFAPLFRLMGFNHIITSEFPIAGGTTKFIKNFWLSIKAICQLRALQFDASVDFIGDAREALFGLLITGTLHRTPRWHHSHWMRSLIWNIKLPFVHYFNISSTQDRIYDVITYILENLTGKVFTNTNKSIPLHQSLVVAFHPFSSQSFKSWPKEYWQELCGLLNHRQITPIVLCSTTDQEKARNLFPANLTSATIIATVDLEDLITHIKSIDLLVGIDSFLVHLAAALDKRSVVINTGNLPRWWQAPNAFAIGQSGGCLHYPCSNSPSCLGSANETQCIKSITPNQVFEVIKKTVFLPDLSMP